MLFKLLHLRVVVVVEGVEDADKVCNGEHTNELLLLVVPQWGGSDAIVDQCVECLRNIGD